MIPTGSRVVILESGWAGVVIGHMGERVIVAVDNGPDVVLEPFEVRVL